MKEHDIRPKKLYDEFKSLVKQEVAERFAGVKCFFVDCPACAGQIYYKVFSRLGFDFCECSNCRTIFVNPVPEHRAIDDYYRQSMAVKFFAEQLYENTKNVRREKIFKPRAELVAGLKDKFGFKDCLILDIGGGTGLLADELKSLNMVCDIVEPSADLAKVCRNKEIKTYNMLFEEFDFKVLRQDPLILTSFELVEHLKDPVSFFSHAYQGMKKGDLFFFTTLNGTGFDLRVLWEKADAFLPPLHLVLFNVKSIKILMEKIGFDVIEISTPGKLDWDIVEGAYKNNGINIDKFWQIVVETADDSIKQSLQNWLSANGFSSHMRVIVRKT
jgi:2-polyprenyl-3-methyl-5-hydroxy-6-metoxy-1,4-benzoquinol methylase